MPFMDFRKRLLKFLLYICYIIIYQNGTLKGKGFGTISTLLTNCIIEIKLIIKKSKCPNKIFYKILKVHDCSTHIKYE